MKKDNLNNVLVSIYVDDLTVASNKAKSNLNLNLMSTTKNSSRDIHLC